MPLRDRTSLLSDYDPDNLSRVFGRYLWLLGIRHIVTCPYHPQTNGKLERYQRTLNEQVKLVVFETPTALRRAVAAIVDCYNHCRYEEGIGNVTPAVSTTGAGPRSRRAEGRSARGLYSSAESTIGPAGGERAPEVSVRK